MLENNNKYKLLKVFLDNPTDNFRLRELSRITKISPPSVMNYLKEFENKGLVKTYKKRDIPFYISLRDNEKFKLYKKLSIFLELNNSGFVDFLWEKLSPNAIILYGSYAKGESTEYSDVDLFIISKEKNIDISSFERKINKKVHIMFEDNIKKIPNELKNNIINGIILKGYVKFF